MSSIKTCEVRSYRDLVVWQKAIALVTDVYRCTRTFPKEEIYGLSAQLRRAAVSVPSNIAEGQGRVSTGEFRQFLGHARGSLLEVETQLEIARNLEYLSLQDCTILLRSARGWPSIEWPYRVVTEGWPLRTNNWPLITDHWPLASDTNFARLPDRCQGADA